MDYAMLDELKTFNPLFIEIVCLVVLYWLKKRNFQSSFHRVKKTVFERLNEKEFDFQSSFHRVEKLPRLPMTAEFPFTFNPLFIELLFLQALALYP